MKFKYCLGICALFTKAAFGLPITVIGYNVEGGYKPDATVETIISNLKTAKHADIYMFTELSRSWLVPISQELKYDCHISAGAKETTDAIGICFNPKRYKMLTLNELKFNVHKFERPALYAQLVDLEDHRKFIVMGNHLMRGKGKSDRARQIQAKMLNQWVKQQKLPVIALGDYNFDYDIDSGTGNTSFNIFMDSKQWNWLKPTDLIRTNCAYGYNSILDFVFIHGFTQGKSEVELTDPIYCVDDQNKPDHRPVYATINK